MCAVEMSITVDFYHRLYHNNNMFETLRKPQKLAILFAVASLTLGTLPLFLRPSMFLQSKTELPEWIAPLPGAAAEGFIFHYKDIIGRSWFRVMQNSQDTNGLFSIAAESFPKGCSISWFSTDQNILSIRSEKTIDRIGAKGGYLGSQYPRKVITEAITGDTLKKGIRIGLLDTTRRGVFFRVVPKHVVEDSWHNVSNSTQASRVWLGAITILLVLTACAWTIAYRSTSKLHYAIGALVAIFWLSGMIFDRPFSGFGGQIDAGDDSYYVAYAQNFITKKSLFSAPVRINFGARHVPQLHGIPGVALFLAPALVAEAALSGKTLYREIDLDGLRSMRLLSAIYMLLAMIALCWSFHLFRISGWNIVFPTMFLVATTMPKWTFQRSIFTHSIEMFLLCSSILLICYAYKRSCNGIYKGALLAATIGACAMVRGEYLLLAPVIPFIVKPPINTSYRCRNHITFIVAYFIALLPFILLYLNWTGKISTGYGRLSSSQTQSLSGAGITSAISVIIKHGKILIHDYLKNGAILLVAFIGGIGLLFTPSRQDNLLAPFNRIGLATLVLLMFLLNASFHTPLGMEWGHRYSLKLYPFAFWILWIFIMRVPSKLKITTNLAFGIYMLICLTMNWKWFSTNMAVKDTGRWIWSDAQILTTGIGAPYGLYHILGLVLFLVVAGWALVTCGAAKRQKMLLLCGFFLPIIIISAVSSMLHRKIDNYSGVVAQASLNNAKKPSIHRLVLRELPLVAIGHGSNYPWTSIWKRPHTITATGWLYAPQTSSYDFYVEGDGGYQVLLDGITLVKNLNNTAWRSSGKHATMELSRGLHKFDFTYKKTTGNNEGAFRIKWAGGGIPDNSILSAPYLVHSPGFSRSD